MKVKTYYGNIKLQMNVTKYTVNETSRIKDTKTYVKNRYSVTIPLHIIRKLKWKKQMKLKVHSFNDEFVVIRKMEK